MMLPQTGIQCGAERTGPSAQVQHPAVLVLGLRIGHGGAYGCLRIIDAPLPSMYAHMS